MLFIKMKNLWIIIIYIKINGNVQELGVRILDFLGKRGAVRYVVPAQVGSPQPPLLEFTVGVYEDI
jgi:hypothetical protein